MAALGTSGRPLRVAIVGSGPAGFFTAEALCRAGIEVSVDLYERLPTPYGLIRGGVAPDHPKIKTVTRVFDKIAEDPRVSWFGNVTVGPDITVPELRRCYDAVVMACGTETSRTLDIPGEELRGCHSATAFVGWYNGHPSHAGHEFDLDVETAVIVGHGNVSLDICRMLVKPVNALNSTDMAGYALDALSRSRIREIHIIGRRGPAQAKFTATELRELGEIPGVQVFVEPSALELDAASAMELAHYEGRHAHKNMEALQSFTSPVPSPCEKRVFLRFLMSPVRLEGVQRLESAVFENNQLEGEPFQLRAAPTGKQHRIRCGLLFRSVGYMGSPVAEVPFDADQGIIPNRDGRVLRDSLPVPGLYAAGWIKRGPTGIIGTNKADSKSTVDCILADLPQLEACPEPDPSAPASLLARRGIRVLTYDDWKRIDAREVELGLAAGKPRVKFTSIEEMLRFIGL